MSKLGITLLYIALAGAAVAGFFGWRLIVNYNEQKTTVVQKQQEIDTATRATVNAKHEADMANQAKEQATTELAETSKKMTDLNSQLGDAQKQQETLKSAVQTSKDAQAKAEQELLHVKEVLGMSPEEMKTSVDKLNQQVVAYQSEQKILQDQLGASAKQIADLHDALDREGRGGIQPPGISGKVTFVNRAWNFVVLNVGLSSGVVPKGELIVYRGRNFLGKVRITSAESNSSVGDILPGAKADIQTGDDVLN